MGFEDEITNTDDAVQNANAFAENQRKEAELRQAETLAQMEENRQKMDEKQKRLVQLSEVLGITEMRHKMDQQDESIKYLAGRMDESIKQINNILAVIQGQPLAPQVATDGGDKHAMLLQALNSPLAEKIIDKLLGSNTAAAQPSLISQELINEKMTSAFMDDLATGENIRKFISDSLKKQATKAIVNKSLGDIGKTIHEPE